MEQKVIDHIKAYVAKQTEWLDRINSQNSPLLKDLFLDIQKAFTEESPMDDRLVNRIKAQTSYELQRLLQDLLGRQIQVYTGIFPWTIDHTVVKALIRRQHFTGGQHDGLTSHVRTYIYQQLTQDTDLDLRTFIKFLYDQGFSDEDITAICVAQGDPFYYHHRNYYIVESNRDQTRKLTKFADYLLPLLKPSSGFLGFGKTTGLKKVVDDVIMQRANNSGSKTSWLHFLMDHYPDGIEDHYAFLHDRDYNNKVTANISAILLLIDQDAARFEGVITKALRETAIDAGNKFGVVLALNEKLNNKYKEEILRIGEEHFSYYGAINHPGSYYYEPRAFSKSLSEAYTDFLFNEKPEEARQRIQKLFRESLFLNYRFFKYVEEKFGTESLPFIIEALKKDPQYIPKYELAPYYNNLFEILEKHNLKEYKNVLISFALAPASKKSRELACKALSKIDQIIDDAKVLLNGKTVDERVVGALILSVIGTGEAELALNNAVDAESNDDTRDIMLEALREKRFKESYSKDQVKGMITHASKRKKLNKWNEKWIDEQKLPKLNWKETTEPLQEIEVRFLLYRMKRATGLNSDIEARQLLNHIDRSTSAAFAKALLVAFQDSNADSKLKYYLTLSALLGDDDLMHKLNTLFNKSISDKRVKMAEYVVGALAMVGSDKALRMVEVIYRKFATKKPAVSQAAKDALDAAATELNITMDELSDRIIPNFGFEGLYKNFTCEGEEYRAFINSEFKLNYFTEDNKIRKSLPASASKELKVEFKDIEKELNNVTKTQSGRLEKYMIEERKWPVESWRTFFFNNPIMFVYALKLIWGVYNKDGNLVTSFYCSEDTSLYKVDDEEVSLEEEHTIGILHPAHLTSEMLTQWKDKLYALSMVTVFPILERPVFSVKEDERERNYTKEFFNKEIPKGADFVNTFLVKQNWLKSSGDGGRSEFTKPYKDGSLKAYANIDGPTAWYQGGTAPARMFDVTFVGKNWNEKVMLKDIPIVFYSEVLADIHLMINTN